MAVNVLKAICDSIIQSKSDQALRFHQHLLVKHVNKIDREITV